MDETRMRDSIRDGNTLLKLGPAILAAVAFLYSLVRYSDLPGQIPVHWGPGGLGNELDRPVGAFLIPGIVLGLWLLALQVDDSLEGQPRIRKAHLVAVNGFAGLLVLFHFLVLNVAPDVGPTSLSLAGIPNPFGPGIESGFTLFVLLGLLLIVVSLPMIASVVPPNRWYGARTSRTLDDPEEWYRVNRRSGVLVGAVGAVLIATAGILYLGADLSARAYAYICMAVVVGGLVLAGASARP